MTSSNRGAVAADGAPWPQPAVVGSDLIVSLACPECGTNVWIKWRDLRGGLRCSKCQCQFFLNRSGKLQSLADLPQVSYTCPRCKQSASLPAMLTVCKAECVVCTLPLVRGPDQRRHEIGEARQMQQAARLEGKKGGNRWWEKHWMTDDGRLRKINVALAALLFLGLLCAGALAVGRLFDNSPESRVRAFTYMCLAGNQNGAIAYLPDDMVQCAEFDRWRTRYFPSILDEHRPAGDVVRIDVEMIGETPQTRVVRVTMTSRFMGKRAHEQRWQKTGDQWFFDPAITLKMHDQP